MAARLLHVVPVLLVLVVGRGLPPGVAGNRHAVHWNSSNLHLLRSGYTVQVSVNDYLDIYCPHYNASGRRAEGHGAADGGGGDAADEEQYALYMVDAEGYRTCNSSGGSKRWECRRGGTRGTVKFSEKFQRYSAFSLGFEFRAGTEYYYISTPTPRQHHSCLRMKVFVCCASTSQWEERSAVPTMPPFTLRPDGNLHGLERFNPSVPKLEKSISGTNPTRDRLPMAASTALLLLLAVLPS